MKNLLVLITLVTSLLAKAQEKTTTTLRPYFDPKDKEVLLNINEETGKIEGVLSLNQGWVDKAFSKDGRYLFLCSSNTVYKIDLEKFAVIAEKQFFTPAPKEEWNDHSSTLPDTYAQRFKVSSHGNVLFFQQSSQYRALQKQIFEKKRTRDKECDLVKNKGGDYYTEWKQLFDKHNKEIQPLEDEKNSLIGFMDLHLFNFGSNSSEKIGSSFVGLYGHVSNDIFMAINSPVNRKDSLFIINLQKGTLLRKDIETYRGLLSISFTPEKCQISDIDELYLQFSSGMSQFAITPINEQGVLSTHQTKEFNSWGEYMDYWTSNLLEGNNQYYIDIMKKNTEMPKMITVPAPDRDKLKKKEYEAAFESWKKEQEENLAKFQKEMDLFLEQAKKPGIVVSKIGETNSYFEDPEARIAYLYEGNKLVIDREFELELYDLESKKTIWITELDY